MLIPISVSDFATMFALVRMITTDYFREINTDCAPCTGYAFQPCHKKSVFSISDQAKMLTSLLSYSRILIEEIREIPKSME